jgi:hypothetical protein
MSDAAIVVNAGGNLQAALDRARAGQVIQLEAGATYVGNFTTNTESGSSLWDSIGIRTNTLNAVLPTGLIPPEYELSLPTLRSPNSLPALNILPRSGGYNFRGIRFVGTGGDIVQVGSGLIQDKADLPRSILFEQIIVKGEGTAKRGIQANGSGISVRHSRITGIKLAGQESQSIACWNGTGVRIQDCYIEAGSIGVLIGGERPGIPGHVPSNIELWKTTITRPLEMRAGSWVVKNLFELKNARKVTARENYFSHNWPQGQNGFSILFTVRGHGSDWSEVTEVDFSNNTLQDVAAGINILGRDDSGPSQVATGISIASNTIHTDHTVWGGNGAFLQIGGGPSNLHVYDNEVNQSGNIISAYSIHPAGGFRFQRNRVRHNAYGVYGDAVGTGNVCLARYFPGSVFTENIIQGGNPALYPTGNTFV